MPMPSQSSLSSHESSSVGRRNSGGGGKLRNSFRMASSGGLAASTRGSKEQLSQCLTLPNIMSHAIQQHQQYQYRRGSSDSFKKMRTSREGLASSSIEHYEHLHQQPRRNSLRRSSCQSAHHLIRKSSGEPSHTPLSSSSKRVSGFGVRSATTNNNQNVEWDEITTASSVKATRLTRPSLTLSPLILLPLSSDEPSRDDKDEKQQEVKTKPTLLEQSSLDDKVDPGVVALTSSSSMQPKEEQQHQAEQTKPVHPASHSPRSQTNPINSITSTTQEPQCNVPVSNSKPSSTSTTNEQQQLPFTSWIGSKRLLSEQGDEYETVITKSDDRTDIDKSSRVEDGEDEAATDHNEKAENKHDDEKDEFVNTATTGTTVDAESESPDTNESPKKSWSEGFINSCPTWISFFLPNVQVNIIEDTSTKNKINYPIKNVCFSTQEDIISYEVTPDDIKHSWISINIPRTLHNIQMISAHRGIKVSYSSIAANTLGKTTMVHIEPTNLIDCMEQSRDRYVQAVLREQERQRTEGEYEENNGMLDVDKLGKVASKYSQWSVELALSSWWLER